MAEICGARFALHPYKIGVVAICQLPPGHEGRHDNNVPEEYDPETDQNRWSYCGAPHPDLPGVSCRVQVFDDETHDGTHQFLVRWDDDE